MKHHSSFFRIFLIAAITFAVCTMTAGFIYWQKSHTNNEFKSSTEEIATRSVGEEIVSLRTANTQTFKGSNPNELTTHIYVSDKYYLDTTNVVYKEIDTTTHELPVIAKLNPFKTYDAFVDAGNYKATWFADKPWNYKFSVGDSWIAYEALFDESASLAIKVETLSTGIKETITLKDETSPTILEWKVTESVGESAIITPPPTAVDADGKDIPVSESKTGNILTYEVDTRGAVFPILVDPTTSITTQNDGYVYTSQATYAEARNATSGTSNASDLRVGQMKFSTPTYRNYRTFLSFPIPDMASISAASINLYGYYDFSTTDFNIGVFGADAYGPTLSGADFKNFDGWKASGVYSGTFLNYSAWSSANYVADWNNMGPFSPAGLDAIFAKKGSTFYAALVSFRDYGNTPPPGSEYITEFVVFDSSVTAGHEPYLSITYTVPVSAPTVTTQDASSITTTAAVFNGSITAVGGINATVRGFTYGTDSSLATPIATTVENGSFSTGAFTGTPSSVLTCNTTYYYRAYATNSGGTGLGTIATFTTSACAVQPINGVCDATHYNCTSPLPSINWVDGATFWTWVCPGSNGGNPSPQCSEAKPIQQPTTSCTPLYLAPTHIYTQQNSNGTVTAFTRTIQVIDISPTEERVISTVSWNYHGIPRSVTITDHLTPWQ